jgi:hypothetical protein
MKILINRLILTALLLAVLVFTRPTGMVQAGAVPIAPVSDVWRSGVQVNQNPPPYSVVSGRARSAAAQFTSASSDSFYLMEAPGSPMIVRYALVRILSRGGNYTGLAVLDLEIRNMNGMLVHTVSSTSFNLQTAPNTAWLIFNLSDQSSERTLQPGEALLYHFYLSGAAGGDFSATVLFEAAVSNLIQSQYLPLAPCP